MRIQEIEDDPTLKNLFNEVQQAREALGLPESPEDYIDLPLERRLNIAAWVASGSSDYGFCLRQTKGDVGYAAYKFPDTNSKDQSGFMTTTLSIEGDAQIQLGAWAQYKVIKEKDQSRYLPALVVWAQAQDINGRGNSVPRCLGMVGFVDGTPSEGPTNGSWIGQPIFRAHVESGLNIDDTPAPFDDVRAMNVTEIIDVMMCDYFTRVAIRRQQLGRQALQSMPAQVIALSDRQSA